MFGNPFYNRPAVHFCGIYYHAWHQGGSYKTYLPQVDVSAHATILANTSRTVLTQTFANTSTEGAIREARYVFPLYDGVSVVSFTCLVGDRTIIGEVKEKDRARADFKEAVSKGETAGLLEQLPDASDVFTTTVGNIPPGAKLVVTITYLGELKQDMEVDGIRFTIPNIICPRYGDYPAELQSGSVVDAVGGSISITVDAEMADGSFIQKMLSPTHPISMSMGTTSSDPDAEPTMTKASSTLSLGTACLDKDFVLQVTAKNTGVPKAVVENHPTIPNHRALMATLVPKFALPAARPEVVFVIDRSGSMGGNRIDLAKQALLVFLKSLPVGVKFNICSFGSSHSFLWPKSVTYNQTNLEQAVRHAEMLMADYGGTEMLRPVEAAIENRYTDMSLEVVLLTDGEIYNQNELFFYLNSEVAEAKKPIRVFTLGIGNGVSHSLIEGVARAGNGFSQTVEEGEKMDSKVVRMLKGALSPHIDDYTLEVKYSAPATNMEDEDDFEMVEKVADSLKVNLDLGETDKEAKAKKPISLFDPSADLDDEDTQVSDETGESRYTHLPAIPTPKIIQAPQNIPSLYAFNRTTVYLLLGPEAPSGTPKSVVLRGSSSHGPLELEIPIQVLDTPGSTIHQLAAKKAIAELEQGRGWLSEARGGNGELLKVKCEGRFDDMVEREAVRLGVLFQVGGKWCSFVATEKNQPAREKESWKYLDDGEDESLKRLKMSAEEKLRCEIQERRKMLQKQMQAQGFQPSGPRSQNFLGSRMQQHSSPWQQASQQQMQAQGFQPSGPWSQNFLGSRMQQHSSPWQQASQQQIQQSMQQPMSFGAPVACGGRGGGFIPSVSSGRGGRRGGSMERLAHGSSSGGSSPAFGYSSPPAVSSCFASQAQSVNNGALNTTKNLGAPFGNSTGSPFGNSTSKLVTSSFSEFGGMGASSNALGSSLFGGIGSNAPSNPAFAPPPGGLFSGNVNKRAPADLSQSGGLFGGSSNAGTNNPFPAPASGSSLFGGQPNIQSPPAQHIRFGSSTPASAPAPPTTLHSILLHQTFSGAFPFSEALLTSLSVALKDFGERRALEGIDDLDVFTTAVVVVFFEGKMAREKDSWELVVEKARQWMEDRCQGVEGVEKVIAAARKLIV